MPDLDFSCECEIRQPKCLDGHDGLKEDDLKKLENDIKTLLKEKYIDNSNTLSK